VKRKEMKGTKRVSWRCPGAGSRSEGRCEGDDELEDGGGWWWMVVDVD